MSNLQFIDFKNNRWYYNSDFLRESRRLYKENKRDFIKHLLRGILPFKRKLNRISLNAIEYWNHPYTSLILFKENERGLPSFHNLSEALTSDIDYLNVAKELYNFFEQRQRVLLINKPCKVSLVFNFDKKIKEMIDSPVYIEISDEY